MVIRFGDDSGDGRQLTDDRLTAEASAVGNDPNTPADPPAEIRAPYGTLAGTSSVQLHFANYDIPTPGDRPDVLVAMNPAELEPNVGDPTAGAELSLNTGESTRRTRAGTLLTGVDVTRPAR